MYISISTHLCINIYIYICSVCQLFNHRTTSPSAFYLAELWDVSQARGHVEDHFLWPVGYQWDTKMNGSNVTQSSGIESVDMRDNTNDVTNQKEPYDSRLLTSIPTGNIQW